MTELKTLVRTEMDRAGEPSFGMGDIADRRARRRRKQRIAADVISVPDDVEHMAGASDWPSMPRLPRN